MCTEHIPNIDNAQPHLQVILSQRFLNSHTHQCHSTLPATSKSVLASNSVSHPSILYLAAFNRVKTFIKVLKNELDLLSHDSSENSLMFSLVKMAGGSKSAIVE
jgi:hypothetical protein